MTDYVKQAQRFVGIPWKHHGRTKEAGVDCYGLYLLFAREILGQDPPDFIYDAHTMPEQRDCIYAEMHKFKPIAPSTPGALVIMEYFNCMGHIAVYLGSGYILTTQSDTGATIAHMSDIDHGRTLEQRIKEWKVWA